MIAFLALGATAAMATALLWAGLEKGRHLASFASVLRELGLPARAALTAAVLVVGGEIAAALALLLAPSTPVFLTILMLAAGFAAAGWIALRRHHQIRCGCFGPYGGRVLGKGQLAALPLWAAAVALASFGGLTAPDWLPVAVALGIATVRTVGAARVAYEGRGDRRSATEMLAWLNR